MARTARRCCGRRQSDGPGRVRHAVARQGDESRRRVAGLRWRQYGGQILPLDQINRDNVADLKVAWEWRSPDADIARDHPDLMLGDFQATPIMVDGIL